MKSKQQRATEYAESQSFEGHYGSDFSAARYQAFLTGWEAALRDVRARRRKGKRAFATEG